MGYEVFYEKFKLENIKNIYLWFFMKNLNLKTLKIFINELINTFVIKIPNYLLKKWDQYANSTKILFMQRYNYFID